MLSAAVLKAATIPARMKMHRAHGIRHIACNRKEVQLLLIGFPAHLPILLNQSHPVQHARQLLQSHVNKSCWQGVVKQKENFKRKQRAEARGT